jgi:hypothetical protein
MRSCRDRVGCLSDFVGSTETIWSKGIMNIESLKESLAGVQNEINKRSVKMKDIRMYFYGDEYRFIKQPKDCTKLIANGIKVYREWIKLRVIREDLRFLIDAEMTYQEVSIRSQSV